MINLKSYDDANAKNFNSLSIKSVPTLCWPFFKEFTEVFKDASADFDKITAIAKKNSWRSTDWELKTALIDSVIILTDSNLKIVYASKNLSKLNGYNESDVLGNSPKMFHGVATCHKTSYEIREAISKQIPFEKQVLNYKKNGKSYICNIKSYPIFNKHGNLSHFIAFEKTI